MSQDFIRGMAAKARRRAVATVMNHAERQFRPLVSKDDWEDFRDVVLNAMAMYHDQVMDIMLTLGEGPGVVNEEALMILQRLQSDQSRIAKALELQSNGRSER